MQSVKVLLKRIKSEAMLPKMQVQGKSPGRGGVKVGQGQHIIRGKGKGGQGRS